MPISAEAKATYTTILREAYPQLFASTSPHEIVAEPVAEGIQNYNFNVLIGGKPAYFFSIIRLGQGEIADPEHQRALLATQQRLAQSGLSVPEPLATPAGALDITIPARIATSEGEHSISADIAGKMAVLYRHMPGRAVDKAAATLADFADMGALHGQFLKAGESIAEAGALANPVSFPALKTLLLSTMGFDGSRDIPSLLTALADGSSAESAQLAGQVTLLRSRVDAVAARGETPPKIVTDFITALEGGWYQRTLAAMQETLETAAAKGWDALPKTLLHNDVHLGNVFAERAALFDMGWMGYGTRLADICQPMVLNAGGAGAAGGWNFDPEKAKAFLAEVEKHAPLTAEEKASMPDMLACMHLRSTVTRLASMMHTENIANITKSPVELTDHMERYRASFLGEDKASWLTGEKGGSYWRGKVGASGAAVMGVA